MQNPQFSGLPLALTSWVQLRISIMQQKFALNFDSFAEF